MRNLVKKAVLVGAKAVAVSGIVAVAGTAAFALLGSAMTTAEEPLPEVAKHRYLTTSEAQLSAVGALAERIQGLAGHLENRKD